MNPEFTSTNPMARVMSLRNFRLLFGGAAASLLGDQFTLIATPWLVLKLTNDPAVLGVVLALEGIPRAVFMLFGGAITDDFSPRRVMLIANIVRFFLTLTMALLVILGAVQLWMIYAFGLAFGIVAGFAVPAENSIVPMLVEEKDLQAGNSIISGVTQLAGFVGPTVAGILIGLFAQSLAGVGLAFAIDALTFVVSAVTLQLIRTAAPEPANRAGGTGESVWVSILSGVRYLWGNHPLRFIFGLLMAVNFLLIGPLMVGIPVLADQRLPEGAAAFGLLMSAFAGGNLAGLLLAGSMPRPDGALLRWLMVAIIAAFGIVIGALGIITSTWLDFGLLLMIGLGNGYMAILLITWMQTRTPQQMMGRMMSLFVFASSGLVPVSQAISGLVSKWNLTLLFTIPGTLVLLIAVWMVFDPGLKALSISLSGVSLKNPGLAA